MLFCYIVFYTTFSRDYKQPTVHQQGSLYGYPWLWSSCCGIYVFCIDLQKCVVFFVSVNAALSTMSVILA